MNFTNFFHTMKKWQYGAQFHLMALLVPISLKLWRGIQWLSMQSSTKSCWNHYCKERYIFCQLDLLCFQQDRAKCPHSTDFHANPHYISRLTHFSFWRHHLAHPRLILQYQDYFLWDHEKNIYEICPANTDNLKQQIQECIKGIPQEMLECVTTAFPSWLQECTEDNGGHLQSVTFK